MAKNNKYTYLYVLQGNYGYGWDDLTESEDYNEIKNDLHDYNTNERNAHRIIKRCILKQGGSQR